MKPHHLFRVYVSTSLVAWFIIFSIIWAIQLKFPSTVDALQTMHLASISKSSRHSQVAFLPNAAISPTASNPTSTNSTTSSQDSQVQNDFSITNNIITLAGVVIALAGLVLAFLTIGGAIAGFFGVREFRRVRRLRKNVMIIEQQVKEQQKQLEQTAKDLDSNHKAFEERLMHLAAESEKAENRLAQLNREIQDQRILEASYYFNEGTRAYRIGDNDHAVEYYLQALQLQKTNARILERLGRSYSNLEKLERAQYYLNEALKIEPENVAALRSLALCYRYTDKQKAIELLERCLKIDPLGYEALDFLGLLYRDQKLIDKAIDAHEQALSIKNRPETEFYLSILLLNSPEGDKMHARELMINASQSILKKEHDQRIRPVWKILIQAGPFIIDDKRDEALQLIQSLTQYITTIRIHEAVKGHLQFLLEGTNHTEWIPEFMEQVQLKES